VAYLKAEREADTTPTHDTHTGSDTVLICRPEVTSTQSCGQVYTGLNKVRIPTWAPLFCWWTEHVASMPKSVLRTVWLFRTH